MKLIPELQKIAEYLGGYIIDDGLSIRIDTGDNTSKENYDDLISDMMDIEDMLDEYQVDDYYADHDTKIIEFRPI